MTNTSDLTPTEIWDISAQLLHTPAYVENYIGAVSSIIPNHNSKILDTACGTSFPTLNLYEAGYKNITAADADLNSTLLLKERFSTLEANIPVIQAAWQQINSVFLSEFDTVINLDNSLVYMDSWSNKQPMAEGDEIFERILLVLRNFYDCLHSEGNLIVGLGNTFPKDVKERTVEIGQGLYKGLKVKVTWKLSYDWAKRHRTWSILTTIDGKELEPLTMKSYMISKDELANLFRQSGFTDIKIINPPSNDSYPDHLISGKK